MGLVWLGVGVCAGGPHPHPRPRTLATLVKRGRGSQRERTKGRPDWKITANFLAIAKTSGGDLGTKTK